MAEIGKFTQPDHSPAYFIDFLEFLDRQEGIRKIREAAAKHLHLAPGQKVLDLGCGIGGAMFPLAEVTGPHGLAAGVDISKAMIEEATKRLAGRSGVEFRVGEACAIPYPDGFFDAARCERVFLYLPDRLEAIREMKRVVKPGGRILLLDMDGRDGHIHREAEAGAEDDLDRGSDNAKSQLGTRLAGVGASWGAKGSASRNVRAAHALRIFPKSHGGHAGKAAEQGTATREEVEEFLQEQAVMEARGDFFQAWFWVMVSGTV